MPAKKKSNVVTVPKTWLIAAALLLGTVVAVQAVNKNMQTANVNEVKTSTVQEGTFTGLVTRELTSDSDKEHERYYLTTDAGTKYMLIGLKAGAIGQPQEDKPMVSPAAAQVKGQGQGQGQDKKSAQPISDTPKSSPKAGTEDVNTFEQYVGKKVTISGIVVPVKSDTIKASKAPNVDTPEKSPTGNSGQNSKKPDTGNSAQKSAKPMASATTRSPKPDDGSQGVSWDYDRLVVKSIVIAN